MDAQTASPAPFQPTPRAVHVAHAWLKEGVFVELNAEAIRRGVHVDRLTADIVEAVLMFGLADQVLGR